MVALPLKNESRMLATIRNYPRTVNLLLCATLLLTLAKAITFPYLVIYLTSHFALDITQVGLVIGSSLIVGSLLSVYGGFLVDRINSYRLLLGLSLVFVLGFIGTVLAQNIWSFYGCLILINLAYAVIDIAVKAGFASLLPEDARSEVFSIKYTLTNIGYAVGPFFGAMVAKLDISLPFILSALLGLGFFCCTGAGVTVTWPRWTPRKSRCRSLPSPAFCCRTVAWCASPSAVYSARWCSASSRPICRNTW